MVDILSRVLRVAKKPLRTLFAVYFGLVILLGFLQRKLIYHPTVANELPVAEFPNVTRIYPEAQDIRLCCSENTELGGWLLKSSPGTTSEKIERPLVVFFHGNAGDRSGRFWWYHALSQSNVDILAIDYHGYGDSLGEPSEEALYRSAEAAWTYAVQDLGYSSSQVFIMGVSLGGAAAVHLAYETCQSGESPAGLIVVATFSSMTDVASSHYPWLPVRAILVDRYPSEEKISQVTCPILNLHGDQDRIVEQNCGLQLFEAAPAESACGFRRRWVNLSGAGHNDLLASHGNVIANEVQQFVDIATAK